MITKKKYTDQELAEAHILPAAKTAAERKKADKEFSEFRLSRLAAMTPEQLLFQNLMQIKYTMEDYINSGSFKKEFTFGYFLSEYIHTLHIDKAKFSKQISVHNTKLSRLISNIDKPSEKIMVRLEIHSNNTIPAVTWYRIYEKQREFHLLFAQKLRAIERQHVKAFAKI
jgi:plasmid maintenance system antidote protein VapI